MAHNGHMVGGDADIVIIFRGDSRVEVAIFGYAEMEYSGAYSVNKDGAIQLNLKHYEKWPDMRLYFRGGSALLLPIHASSEDYWPFRHTD